MTDKFEYTVTVEVNEDEGLCQFVLRCDRLGILTPIALSSSAEEIIHSALKKLALSGQELSLSMKEWIGEGPYGDRLTTPEGYRDWLNDVAWGDRQERFEAALRREYPQVRELQFVHQVTPGIWWDDSNGNPESQWIEENEIAAKEAFIANGKGAPLWLEWNQRLIATSSMTEREYKLWKSMKLYTGKKPKKFTPVMTLSEFMRR